MSSETFMCDPNLVSVEPELCAYRMACILAILRGLPITPTAIGGTMPAECVNSLLKSSDNPCVAVFTVADNIVPAEIK